MPQIPDDIFFRSFRKSSEASDVSVGDETIFLHLSRGVYLEIDEIGTVIWRKLTSGQVLSEVCLEIAAEYDVQLEQVRHDAAEFVRQLESEGLIGTLKPIGG